MKIQKAWEKYGNCIIMLMTISVNIILLSFFFDFYYDMNDDVMMKDIMAGVYTGTPDGHNMQTLYILGAFISLLYRLCRSIPWYGLFLFFCQMGSLYLAGLRLLKLSKMRYAKAGSMVLVTVFLWGVALSHTIAIQYTLTCTMLASAAIFLFMTSKGGMSVKEFVLGNIPSILLVILAYQLRTEMLLLVFPFVCLAGLFRWAEEEKFFVKENYLKYGIVIGSILLGMLFSRLIDFAAYGGEDWKSFVAFFNNRTEVYDYHYNILTSGEHKEYLSSIGLSDAQQELLDNYNFGLSEDIDEEIMGKIAEYAAKGKERERGAYDGLLNRLWHQGKLYIYRLLHTEDSPYNILVIAGYICLFIIGIMNVFNDTAIKRRLSFIWELALLGAVRTALWMFILMQGRYPERITHSLYLAELMVLMGMLCMRLLHDERQKRVLSALALIGIICVCYIPQSFNAVLSDMKDREEANRGEMAIAAYCKAHPENFYFEDVYSTVGFSQKIFQNVDNSIVNYDIMGGWMCKSPLYREKLKQFGISTMEDGLLHVPFVYFIIDIEERNGDTDWLKSYYAQKGITVTVEQEDLIDGRYIVYQVLENRLKNQ
ncbi:MAG: hypothetical protein K2N85_10525 [Lachnospiraceae bacterium]|nr:hypothetical protein [Lachnospiraceae bacterium]